MSMGKVFFKRNAALDAGSIIAELLTFPAGKNDDQVDVLSLFGRMLDAMVGATPSKSKSSSADRWDKAFQEKRALT